MTEGTKILNKNTGLFSYRPSNVSDTFAAPKPLNVEIRTTPTNASEIKFVPPTIQGSQRENNQFDATKISKPVDLPKKNENNASKLKRTFSSPNIAKLDDDEKFNEQMEANESTKDFLKINTTRILVEKQPEIEKPIKTVVANFNNNNSLGVRVPNVNRNNKPMPDHEVKSRIEDLDPTFGNVPQGLTGIRNFGNTCFLNSILQCLNSTKKLVDFFLSNQYKNDLNRANDLGFRGEIADEFCVIVKAIWGGHCRIIAPYRLRKIIGQFNQQFISNDQQDSQELLLFLLDGLHEDLNRVKN